MHTSKRGVAPCEPVVPTAAIIALTNEDVFLNTAEGKGLKVLFGQAWLKTCRMSECESSSLLPSASKKLEQYLA